MSLKLSETRLLFALRAKRSLRDELRKEKHRVEKRNEWVEQLAESLV